MTDDQQFALKLLRNMDFNASELIRDAARIGVSTEPLFTALSAVRETMQEIAALNKKQTEI